MSDDKRVYFIEAVGGGFIKIGVSNRCGFRLKFLQVGCPFTLRVIADVPGGHALERKLHHQFREHHFRGEWFRDVPAVRREITTLSELQNEVDELRPLWARVFALLP